MELRAHLRDIGREGIECSKRHLSGTERWQVAEDIIEVGGVENYRAEQGRSIQFGDPEKSTMYSAPVLRNAKSQLLSLKRTDTNPLAALGKMQCGEYKDVIHHIGYGPIYVEYCTNNQIHIARNCHSKGIVTYTLDSSGLKIYKIMRSDGSYSASLLIYLLVATCNGESFTIGQMITEVQKSSRIAAWLANLTDLGLPHPQEAVSDESQALLNAMSFNYAGFPSIDQYCNYVFDATPEDLSGKCYIRVDVAHFIKKWADIIASLFELREVQIFYKCLIAHLIKQRNKADAGNVLFSFFAIALSPHMGTFRDGHNTLSTSELEKMMAATGIGTFD